MKKYRSVIILLNLLVVMALFNKSVFDKEELLENGDLVLLKLAPVDPRSLMQGDYMRLNYAIANDVDTEKIVKRGYCIITLDSMGVAQRVRLQEKKQPLNIGEYAIFYTKDNWQINIGADAYFFEEGQAEKFEEAEYGGLIVDQEGDNVLVGLYDENLKLIE